MKNPFRRIDQPEDETGAQFDTLLDYIDYLEDEIRRLKQRGDTGDDFRIVVDIDPAKQEREYVDTWGK